MMITVDNSIDENTDDNHDNSSNDIHDIFDDNNDLNDNVNKLKQFKNMRNTGKKTSTNYRSFIALSPLFKRQPDLRDGFRSGQNGQLPKDLNKQGSTTNLLYQWL